jgi:ABC-type phosphate transport system substrate-binding protein
MRKYKQLLSIVSLILMMVLGSVSMPALADIVVVVSSSSELTSLNADQVKLIFLKKRKKFPDGNPAEPINQPQDSAIYTQFVNKVLDKDPGRMKAYWSMQIFSGKGTPPKQADDDKAVKAMVSHSSSAIGYIDSKSVDSSVKVLFTVP